ncbi:uncharacterized protein LOC133888903 [Phragmites australis]|uniref:uncharacterized protein LOC133888903 n=1 Tax=Phragmites australis TaxID=29695 RepID=UPI002D78846A|nr:uncharacterized protein LOC133888903 [Phragmites australis]
MDMGDFTFPATAAAASTPEPAGPGPVRHRHFPHFAASPLWFLHSPTAGHAMADEEPRQEKAGAGGGAVHELEEDRMDLLWEDFNEELALRGAGGSCSRAALAAAGDGLDLSSSSSCAESEPEPAGRVHVYGCAPVLRASSRAGGAGHYRRRTDSWVLLMRIFRRLFVIEKTFSAAARKHPTRAR